ncbi:hypothetical protein AGMMS50233_10520 [Endomicrobiia bacterium]|nr:hypothetical protein AGMMS50233_10520 [Endomicrobiia bacterium]
MLERDKEEVEACEERNTNITITNSKIGDRHKFSIIAQKKKKSQDRQRDIFRLSMGAVETD